LVLYPYHKKGIVVLKKITELLETFEKPESFPLALGLIFAVIFLVYLLS
jgi:energy-converting hydrogenase Eha subunit F